MASLTEKVKDTVQGRSRHRKAASDGNVMRYTEPQSSGLYGDGGSSTGRESPSYQESPAWHIHKGKWRPMPTGSGQAATASSGPAHPQSQTAVEKVPPRDSSLRHPHRTSYRNSRNVDVAGQDQSETLPSELGRIRGDSDARPTAQRTSSNRWSDYSALRDGEEMLAKLQRMSMQYDNRDETDDYEVAVDTQVPVQIDPVRHSMDPPASSDFDSHDMSHNGAQITTRKVATDTEMVSLPEGFELREGHHTNVETTWRPAVTHETVHRQTTELVQKNISRDIHVHHYYTYTQPIRVVEILPAKHYLLDESTGERIEIPEPEGWQMPEHMRPYQPDTSNIKASTRHYLVNEEHPRGIPELPPLRHKPDRGRLGGMSQHIDATAA